MILHLCHHWFWITNLSVLLIMTVIAQAHNEELEETTPSHHNPVRSKFKAVLLNVTRLYPVPDATLSSGPEGTFSSSLEELSSSDPERVSISSSRGTFGFVPAETFIPALGRSSTTDQPLTSSVGLLSEVEIVVPEGDLPYDKLSNERPSMDTQSEELSKLGTKSSLNELLNEGGKSFINKETIRDKSYDKEQWSRLDSTLFASESVESKELPSLPGDYSRHSSAPVTTMSPTAASHPFRLSDKELLTDSDSGVSSENQSDRLEREIRKNNASQSIHVHTPPSFEPSIAGLEHDKLRAPLQEITRRISTTETPLNETEISEIKETEEPYTIFVTPLSPYATSNNLTTHNMPLTGNPTPAIEIVKKSDGLSKIKDKVDVKAKFSAKIKEKTKPLNYVTSVDSQGTSTSSSSQSVEDLTSATPVLRTNESHLENYQVLNDSPETAKSVVVQENVTELAFENTSISADYEDLNLTSPSSNINTSTIPRNPSHGRALEDGLGTHERIIDSRVAEGRALDKPSSPLAHAEDYNSNSWGAGDMNVALISGVSFGALALVTLFGAVSFIMYRRYRWNKPQTLSDKCSNPDSSGYIDDSTLRENSEEMYSLDNDSFLNSLEAMTIQNYWTDHVKHTKL